MTQKQHSQPYGLPSVEEMMQCLRRSGYMLESRVVQSLDAAGFFVEPNQSFRDERTDKSREIDILAEFFNYNPDHSGVYVKTTFLIEVINNSYPFVLTTQRPWSPNSPTDDYIRYATTPGEDSYNPFMEHVDILETKGVDNWRIYSQYCAFTRKKKDSQLMADHPDDVHSSIQKMAEYSLDAIQNWALIDSDTYWRLFFWQPVLVLRGDLFFLSSTADSEPELTRADAGKLEYNFHYRERPESMIVDIVTEERLLDMLQEYVRQDEIIEQRIYNLKTKGAAENTDQETIVPGDETK